MSFYHLIRKPNARSQLERVNENSAIVLFDPKVAYEHLVDQRKASQKDRQDSELKAVDHDQAIEDARKNAERVEDTKAYARRKDAEAQVLGVVSTEDESRYGYTGNDEEDEDLQAEMAEARVVYGELYGNGDAFDDDEDEAFGGDGMVDYDSGGNPITKQAKSSTIPHRRELEKYGMSGKHAMLGGKLDRGDDERGNTFGLLAQPWAVEMKQNVEEEPTGEATALNIAGEGHVLTAADAGVHAKTEIARRKEREKDKAEKKRKRDRDAAEDVAGEADLAFGYGDGYGYMTAAEEDVHAHGGEYAALGPQYAGPIAPEEGEGEDNMVWGGDKWVEGRPGGETPEWTKEECIDAQDIIGCAEKAKEEALQAMREARTEEYHVKNMIETLEQEFPELAGTVRCYTKRQQQKRKAETLDAEAETDGRPRKRIRAKAPDDMLSAITAWHNLYNTVLTDYAALASFLAPPSWPCTKHGCAERREDERNDGKLFKACKHNIKACLAGLTRAELKRCKVAFHPDRFHVCKEGKSQEWRAMAEEVFVVVGREADKRGREEDGGSVAFGVGFERGGEGGEGEGAVRTES